MNDNTIEFDILGYLQEALTSFANDPADTDYQRGYEAALTELQKVVTTNPKQANVRHF